MRTWRITSANHLAGDHDGDDWSKDASRDGFAIQETLTYDEDGNLTGDARWDYRWDAENRLQQMETTAVATAQGVPRLRLSFHYDWQGRHVRKVVESFHDTSWIVTSDTRFLYDER